MVDESWLHPAVAQSVPTVRNEVAELARRLGATEGELADLSLAVSEAAANVVVHAYRDHDEPGEIAVDVHAEDHRIEVAIRDWGRGLSPRPDSPGMGLGLSLIGRLAQRFEVRAAHPGTRLCMCFGISKTA